MDSNTIRLIIPVRLDAPDAVRQAVPQICQALAGVQPIDCIELWAAFLAAEVAAAADPPEMIVPFIVDWLGKLVNEAVTMREEALTKRAPDKSGYGPPMRRH